MLQNSWQGGKHRQICLVFSSQRVCLWLIKLPLSCINVLWLFPCSAWRRTQDTKMRSTAYLPISLSLVERLVLIWLFIFTNVQFLLLLPVDKKRIWGLETSFGGCWLTGFCVSRWAHCPIADFLPFLPPPSFHMITMKCLLRNSTWIWLRKTQITVFSLCPSSGSCLVQKTTWFIFGTFRQKRLYRNYKDTQVRERILFLLK